LAESENLRRSQQQLQSNSLLTSNESNKLVLQQTHTSSSTNLSTTNNKNNNNNNNSDLKQQTQASKSKPIQKVKGKPGRKRAPQTNIIINTSLSKEEQTKKSLQLNRRGKKSTKRQRRKSTSSRELPGALRGALRLNNPTTSNNTTPTSSSINNTNNSSSSNSGGGGGGVLVNDANLLRLVNDPNTFSLNSLFHSPASLLTKLDLKALFQPVIFESLPRQSQLKLIKLLPECDRQLDSHGSFK
jgi:hypothetical protein